VTAQTKIYSQVRIGEHSSATFAIHNSLKQGDALLSLLLNCALDNAIMKVRVYQ